MASFEFVLTGHYCPTALCYLPPPSYTSESETPCLWCQQIKPTLVARIGGVVLNKHGGGTIFAKSINVWS